MTDKRKPFSTPDGWETGPILPTAELERLERLVLSYPSIVDDQAKTPTLSRRRHWLAAVLNAACDELETAAPVVVPAFLAEHGRMPKPAELIGAVVAARTTGTTNGATRTKAFAR